MISFLIYFLILTAIERQERILPDAIVVDTSDGNACSLREVNILEVVVFLEHHESSKFFFFLGFRASAVMLSTLRKR
jgi:hypothetical protein